MTSWEVAGATDVGRTRTRNEDAYAIESLGPDAHLLVVCDGMGGHSNGDEASHLAVAAIVDAVRQEVDHPAPFRVLYDAIRSAHADIVAHAGDRDMGSTAVAAWLRRDRAWFGWLGDSRLYHLRDGQIVERSTDHTVVADLVAKGELTDEQARTHDLAHVLARALGAGQAEAHPTVYEEPLALRPGDTLLLCSDGLHDLITDAELGERVLRAAPAQVVEGLIEEANSRGGHDNITVIVARYIGEAARPPAAAPAPAPARQHTVPEASPPPTPAWPGVGLLIAVGTAGGIGGFLLGWWWASFPGV